MCLIITGKSSKVRSTLLDTHGLLNDIFTSNPDGIGFMYGTAKGLKVTKTLPKNIGDATAFIQRIPNDDREIAIHFRWTTHGKTDMLNCHPYDVVPGFIAMMHNGVLHTGNAADVPEVLYANAIKAKCCVAGTVGERTRIVCGVSVSKFVQFLDSVSEFGVSE